MFNYPGSSPYVVDVSSLSSGLHNITFNTIVDGVVRGSATQSFIVSEGAALANGYNDVLEMSHYFY